MTAETPAPGALPDEPLLERERELALLRTLVAEAGAGRAQLALVEGQAGIGKSRLLAELRALAGGDGGFRVLHARASEFERALPFGVVRQLFEPLVRDPDTPDAWLDGAAASARPVLTSLPEASAGDGALDSSFAVLHGLYWLVVNLAADQPLVLSIDDLHWCDRPSLRFLAYALRRIEGLPVLVATTLRTNEPGTDAPLLAEIAHDPATVSVRPGPLSREGVAALVRARLGDDADPAFCDACLRGTGGNPLLLRQLVTALAADGVVPTADQAALVDDIGPRAISRTVLLRLARLEASATSVARAVAVLGESADLPAIAALAELDVAAVGDVTAALARAEILELGSRPAFVHPLVRDAVYHELSPSERERQHARAAQLLRDAGAAVEQVAQHLLAMGVGGPPWTVEVLAEASRSAMRKGAPESAVAYLRRALDEPPPVERRPQLLFDLGLAEAMTNGPAATTILREAYDTLTDPVERGRAATVYARTLLFTRSAHEAATVAHDAAAELPSELADLRQALDAIAAMSYSSGAGDFEQCLRVLAPYRERRIGSGPGAKTIAAISAYAWAVAGGGSAEECVALAREALADDVLLPFDGGFVSVAATFALALADDDGALESADQLRAHAHRRGSVFGVMGAMMWSGYAYLLRGDLPSAESSLRECIELQDAWGETGIGKAYSLSFLAETLVERGDLTGMRETLARSGEGPPGAEGNAFEQRSRILLLLAEGRAEEALDALAGYGRRDLAVHPLWEPWRSLHARALQLLGRGEEAIPLLEEELELARRWGAPGTVGPTLRLLGSVRGGPEGEACLRDAAELLAGSNRRLEHAKALAALGAALRRGRRPAEAREPLREALELADACGAEGLAEEVRAELYATGARPRREALSGAAALTVSERRVADLAAAGRANREIAQALYVTPKTVEVHLTNAYRKLGIRSRRELAGTLGAPPP